MADVQKNVTMKYGTGEKPVGINLCILVFHSILESSKLLQTQDVFKSLKEKKENLGRPFTTETDRLRIQRQAWWLISAANVYDFDHGAVCQTKKLNTCGHIPVRDLTMAYSGLFCKQQKANSNSWEIHT